MVCNSAPGNEIRICASALKIVVNSGLSLGGERWDDSIATDTTRFSRV